MDFKKESQRIGSSWPILLIIVLQLAALGLIIHYEREALRRDLIVSERTGVMVDTLLPGIHNDVSAVSEKASEIKEDLGTLRQEVSQVDRHVGEVGQDVTRVGTRLEGLDKNVNEYVRDRSGLIWGHSLNPYLLIALVSVVVVSIPVWRWVFTRRRQEDEPVPEESPDLGPLQIFSLRLDRLHVLLEEIRSAERSAERPGPELQKLLEQTESLIERTRAELAVLSGATAPCLEQSVKNPEELH